jgi:hypothetical protein
VRARPAGAGECPPCIDQRATDKVSIRSETEAIPGRNVSMMSSSEELVMIRQGDVTVVARCSFEVTEPTRKRPGGWSGSFHDASEALDPAEAELVLPTGHTGRIVIRRVKGKKRGTFVGVGDPPT